MAYLDEAALEREKTKQAMIAGKQPLLGENASAAMHALGVSLGVVPPGTPPSQMTQLLESLIRGPRGDGKTGIKVDEAHPLQVQPYVGRTTASLAQPYQSDDSIGATISGGFSAAKDSSLQQMLRDQQKAQAKPPAAAPAAAPTTNEAPHGPGANRARLAGRSTSDMQGVNAQFAQAAKDYAKAYEEQGGHKVSFTSGYRAGDPREHGKGNAFDMQLTTKDGKPLENYRTNDPATFKAYQDFANGFHQYLEANHPDLAAKHRWGGYFSGDRSKYGSLDLMHHDLAGDRVGMAGGSWKDGLSPQQAKIFPGLVPGGGLAGKPPMARTVSATPAAPATGPHAAGVPSELTEWVAKKENFTNKAFADYGTTNIGYGTAANGRTTIDEPTARAEMNAELGRHLATIDALNPNTPPAIRNSLASLGFNTGGAALKGTGLADAVKRGDWKQAKEIFVQYDKVTDASGAKKPLHGLTIRRGQEAQAFDNPNYYKNPNAGTTAAQDWGGKQDPAATPKSTAAPQASPQAATPTEAAKAPPATPSEAPPSGAAAIAATEAEQLLPEDAPAATPAAPVTPAPAAPVPANQAAGAPAPAKPPAAPVAPPAPAAPVAKPAPPAPPPVNPAHAVLDTKVIDLVKRGGTPEQVAQVPDFIANKTLREAMNLPMIGGRISAGVTPYLGKMGITQQQFDAAVKEGAPKPTTLGKRSEAPMLTEPGKVQYAQADTGTVSDAGPELPAEPAALVEPDGAGTSDATDFSAAARREPTVDPAVLVEQRKPVAEFFDADLDAKDRMAAVAFTEDNNSAQGRIAVHEAGANRIVAAGRPVTDIIDPRYYQAMNDPAMRHKYDAALERVKTDPQFRAQLHAEIDTAHKTGTNYSKLATDFASGDVAARSRTNSTPVSRVGDNQFFIKDRNPEVHGGTTVAANRKWKADTAAGKPATAAPQAAAPEPGKRSDLGTSGATDFSSAKRIDPNAPTLDPLLQKPVQNADGSISTVRTMGINENGKEVNIPTVPPEGGKVMTDAEARQRYQDTGKHLGKFDTIEQAGAAAEKLHQDEAARISEQPKGQQPAQQPQMTPQLAEALTNVYKDESRVAPDPAPAPADALPVLPAQPTGATPGAPGGLSLAPAGLSSIPTGAIPGQAPSQGGSIAMAGMLPPIENATYSTPLLDQTAATSGAGMGLSPIAPQILQGWGWGGGNIGSGLDWGGGGGGFDLGGGGFSMPSFGTGGW